MGSRRSWPKLYTHQKRAWEIGLRTGGMVNYVKLYVLEAEKELKV